jgi:hypothetical protein
MGGDSNDNIGNFDVAVGCALSYRDYKRKPPLSSDGKHII